ncbi:MAG: UDP-N-acetylmuramate dehydrogenase [Paludibacteraceae bacterium]|nr:UDP-N-acetylmuramate dehydrogenase [Paludibacteraceae bacterium]
MTEQRLIPNTFGIPAHARVYVEYTSVEELRVLLQTYKGERLLHIGAGSNLLFTKDFDGVVLHSRICFARALEEDAEGVNIEVGAGIVMDDLIAQVADMGLYGLENLSHIPGEVGASAVQNVGAYGVEAKDVIREVHAVAVESGEECVFSNADCRFEYRDSIFKNEWKGQYIITSVVFHLSKQPQPRLDYGNLRQALAGKEPTPMNIREAVIAIRKQKLPEPEELGSAGSFFKNPIISSEHFQTILQQEHKTAAEIPHFETADGIKIPAAWLIEQCGWKGKRQGGAQVYEKQPLVIVNTGNATAQDIITLAADITESIAQRFQITLHPEVNLIKN